MKGVDKGDMKERTEGKEKKTVKKERGGEEEGLRHWRLKRGKE